MNIKKLLEPNTIAIIGASEKDGFGSGACKNAIDYMDDGSYYFINPKRESVFGVKCYKSIGDLPKDIDLVIICTPNTTIEAILREAKTKNASAAVIYASGYSEVGTDEGRKNETRLKELALELDIAIMGPNCAGFMNFSKKSAAFAFLSDKRDRKGSIGFISQSGQLVLSVMDDPMAKFSCCISAGNSNICTPEDYIDFLVDDDDTKVIAIYLEGIKNSNMFIQSLKKAALKKKPIVILKTGRSEKGQQIAASHTGSMAGSDKIFNALLKKFGAIRVDDLEELLYTSMVLATIKSLPKKNTLASMNLSGGETAICSDVGDIYGINFPDFSNKTLANLRNLLPDYATPNNPLDTTATLSYDVELYAKTLQTVMDDENIGLIAVGYTLLQEISDPCIHYMFKALEIVCAKTNSKPVIMIPFMENTRNKEYADKLYNIGVPILPPTIYAFKIIKYIMDFVAYDYNNYNLDVVAPQSSLNDCDRIVLSETDSADMLSKYGIKFSDYGIAQTVNEAIDISKKISFPIVAKINSADIAHKSDIGGVRLHLNSEEDIKNAYNEIIANAKKHVPNAKINGVLITTMLKQGQEIIIGVKNDAQFGPSILCGMGGVLAEILKDSSLSLAPVSKIEAKNMIKNLQLSKLFKGYRGSVPLDVDSLVELILNVSKFACENKDNLLELDINPVFLYENDAIAADALVVLKK